MKKVQGIFFFLIMIAGGSAAVLSMEMVSAQTPIIYMQDTTASSGLSTYSGRPIQAEYVTSSSVLVGKQIDTITVQLKKSGSPTGNATIGVFNTDLTVKKVFASINMSTLTTSYKNYTFTLPTLVQPYKIQAGDRIGIKFAGGDSTNFVAIMTDQNDADPFDGTNSYHTYYTTAWNNFQTKDLYMTLKLTDIIPPVITLRGSTPVTAPLGSTYVDAGATALDNVDGNLTSSIVTSNPVNTSVLGTYTVTYNVKDSSGNAATQVTRTVNVAVLTSIIYMQDTTASSGLSTYSGRLIQAEYVTSSSVLVGKQIDTILVQLEKSGSPSGTIQVGVFSSDLSAKQVFGTIDASTLTTSYKNYHFSLPKSVRLSQIQTGDRIGIKFTGGDTSNYVAIMTDKTNSFDGTNSYLTYYDTSWSNYTGKDLYMTLAVSDYVAPVITLLGSNTVSTEIGLSYTDPGATAFDFPDGDLTSSIVVSGLVNTGTLGSYTVTYDVSDSQGNAAVPASRTVMVVDTNPPAISITSPLINTIITGPSSGVKINIKGTASDSGSGVMKVDVWNGASYQQANPKSIGDWSSWNSTITVVQQGTISITARATDVAGNQKWFTVLVTVQFSSSSTIDGFGIAKLYPTKVNGREWFSTWNNGHARTITESYRDPYDSTFVITGSSDSKLIIDGNGTANISGGQPRMYVNDPTLTLKWLNTEVTFYGMRISESTQSNAAGFNIGARSLHYNNNDCNVDTYYSRMLYNGNANFAKELHTPDDVKKPTTVNPIDWDGNGGGTMPYDQWIGHKFILRTTDNGAHVRMQMYRDMTGGLNGGIWHLEVDYTDNGNMYVPPNTCNEPLNKIILDANPSVFIRNTDINSALYKDFDIREIAP